MWLAVTLMRVAPKSAREEDDGRVHNIAELVPCMYLRLILAHYTDNWHLFTWLLLTSTPLREVGSPPFQSQTR